jgi:diaminopimelate epimerase
MLDFIKMHGCGNDFMVVDSRLNDTSFSRDQIIELADYKRSVGFDQLLIIENSSIADVKVSIFNCDGSKAQACGNGSRCVAKLILEELNKINITMEINHKLINAHHAEDKISVNMGKAKIIEQDILFKEAKGSLIDVGNLHIVTLSDVNPQYYGKIISQDSRFHDGVNVNFVQLVDKEIIKLQTWERGVGLSLSCGSAACASFAFLLHKNLIKKEITVIQPGGSLNIKLNNNDEIIMTGEASISYYGKII